MENCFGQPTNLLLPVRRTYSSFSECKAMEYSPKTCMCFCGDARLVTYREATIQDVLCILNECEAVSLDRQQHSSHHLNLLLSQWRSIMSSSACSPVSTHKPWCVGCGVEARYMICCFLSTSLKPSLKTGQHGSHSVDMPLTWLEKHTLACLLLCQLLLTPMSLCAGKLRFKMPC